MSDVRTFARDLDAFAAKIGLAPAIVVKKIGFDLHRRIVLKTPVDTGRARASWNISVNQPDRSVEPEIPDDQKLSAGAAAKKALAKQQAIGKLGPTDEIWISNNLPYIVALERGHSRQAPAGMVAVSLAEVYAEIDAIVGAL